MFFETVTNEWNEVTYVPTTLGNVLLAAIIIALLAAAMLFIHKNTKKLSARQLVFCAAAIALGTVLSNIKLFRFPTGGSITLLSMLIVTLPGYWFGLGAGLMTGVAYGVLQLLIDPYVLFPAQLIVDYLLAFGALGLSGLFYSKKHGLAKGYVTGILGRYLFAVISGWIFFGTYAWEGWNPFFILLFTMAFTFSPKRLLRLLLSCCPLSEMP